MLPEDSRLRREIEPEYESWSTRTKTNAILADIYDILSRINSNLVAMASGKPARAIKPYPRPWLKKEEKENERHFGRDPLPPDELREWFEMKRKEHASSSKRNS